MRILTAIALAFAACLHPSATAAQESSGLEGAPIFTALAGTPPHAAGARILMFNTQNPLVDAVAEIASLGGIYTFTSDPLDLNLPNMRRFDLVWIGFGAGFANWSSRCDHLNAYVREGRTLVINQPEEVGLVPCLPADLRVATAPNFPIPQGDPILHAPNLCFTEGMTTNDLTHSTSIVPLTAIGSGWTLVSSTLAFEGHFASMLYAQRNGQILYMDTCFGGRTPSGGCSEPNASMRFRDSLIGCLKQRVAPATCDITLNKDSFVNGETVVARTIRVRNQTAAEVAIEIKTSFDVPGLPPLPGFNLGAYGLLRLPSGYDDTLGPVPLFTVGPALARDMYGLTCRLVNPVTGETMHEDVNIFRVR